jgi:L-ascorbate metabolism protein UlaG (beta-lactamase superfamily)
LYIGILNGYCSGYETGRSRILFLTLTLIAMSAPVFSQNLPEVDKISTSAGDLELFFIGHGSLMFRINDYVIHVDPVKSEGNYEKLPKADLILVTHDHYDHLDTELIKVLRKQETVMFCSGSCIAKIPWAQVMKPGDVRNAGNIKIEAVHAYNIVNERVKGQPFHPKGVGNGYILNVGDKRVYVAGDTENTSEMKSLREIDVAFLPMNLPYTMTPAMVADAARAFKPAILYPYHYGETNTYELVRLLEDTDIEVRIRDLK